MAMFGQRALAWWARPRTRDVLSVLAGVAFLAVAILLPLVGKAGSTAPWAARNARAFETVVLTALGLALAAAASKFLRCRRDGSPMPRVAPTLAVFLLLVWWAFRIGALAR